MEITPLIASFIGGTVGFLVAWFVKPSKKQAGDLSMEGEGALRAEADSLRARVQDLETRLSARDSEVSDMKTSMAASAPAADSTSTAKTTDSDETYALEWQNRYLAARVKYLDSRLAELGDTDAAQAAKPAKAKAATSKKTTKAKTSAKPAAKAKKKTTKAVSKPKTTAVAAAPKKAVAKTSATKAKTSKAKPAKNPNDKYYENIRKYDARASKTVIDNIVKHCGIALKSRDSSLIACSDESELQTVAKGFITKKLGVDTGQMDLAKSICEQMKGQRMKSRVTFYYLAAKKAKKLSVFK